MLGLLCALLLGGCVNEVNLDKHAEPLADKREVVEKQRGDEYRLRPGDKLDVKFFYAPELNDTLTVRTDGRISLQLVGDVVASGATAAELAASISKAYDEVLQAPQATVILRESSARIFVGGEILRPSFVKLDGNLTALQAIFTAGGFGPFAKPSSVILLRKVEGEDRVAVRLDLSDGLMEGREDLQLAADDVVFVPKTAIAKWDKLVEQYVQQAIPIQMSYRRDPFQTTVGNFR